MSSLTGYSVLARRRHFDDGDAIGYAKRQDEVLHWSWDWSNEMASGETVSSAAYVDSGTTRTNVALSSNVTSCDVTGTGEFECTITTSSSHQVQRVFRFYASDGSRATDYE